MYSSFRRQLVYVRGHTNIDILHPFRIPADILFFRVTETLVAVNILVLLENRQKYLKNLRIGNFFPT